MSKIVRVSFSIEQPLLDRLERLVQDSRYANRSEFIRDMVRERLVEQEWDRDQEAVGTVTLVYNHHARNLSEKLTDLQHDFHEAILASTHVHLDKDLCAEIIVVKGRAHRMKELRDLLGQQKGVLHANLAVSSTGKDLA